MCECGECADCLDAVRKAADKRDATPGCGTCGGEGWFVGSGRASGAIVTCHCAGDRRIRDAVARSRRAADEL